MIAFWQSLNTVEQTVIVCVALLSTGIALGASLSTIAECVTHFAETLLAFLMLLVGAAWPRFAKHAAELLEALRKQRRQIQRLRRLNKKQLRGEAA